MENTRKIKVNDHLPRMYEILEKYAIPRDHLILENDLKKYVRDNQLPPIACILHDKQRIIFAKTFSSADKESAKGMIFILNHDLIPLAQKIDDDEKFILYILLHEIAHYNGMSQKQEREADQWALEQMQMLNII